MPTDDEASHPPPSEQKLGCPPGVEPLTVGDLAAFQQDVEPRPTQLLLPGPDNAQGHLAVPSSECSCRAECALSVWVELVAFVCRRAVPSSLPSTERPPRTTHIVPTPPATSAASTSTSLRTSSPASVASGRSRAPGRSSAACDPHDALGRVVDLALVGPVGRIRLLELQGRGSRGPRR